MVPTYALRGVGTALVTPFAEDGSLDLHALRQLVRRQVTAGVDFLVPCGSTGEASTLSEAETLAVVSAAIEAAPELPVFAGCTHNSTAEAVRRARQLASLPGLAGLLSANPYYSKPNQRGQYLHFRAIAEAAEVPVLLYNIPGRTAANLLPRTVLELAELPNVMGVKESSGDMDQIRAVIASAPEDFRVFSGDDALALPVHAAGGHGVISVLSNVVPEHVVSMMRAAVNGDGDTARTLAEEFAELTRLLFSEPNPSPAKAALLDMGLIPCDAVRLPMVPVEPHTRERLRSAIDVLGARRSESAALLSR